MKNGGRRKNEDTRKKNLRGKKTGVFGAEKKKRDKRTYLSGDPKRDKKGGPNEGLSGGMNTKEAGHTKIS